MIKKIGTIEIPVSNMKRAVSFYENVLGLKKSYEHPVWTSFNIEGITFALAISGTKGKEKDTELCKSCSLCVLRFAAGKKKLDKSIPTASSIINFEVENLDEIYKKLKEQGVEFITEPKQQGWGGKSVIMIDPDKNLLVLYEA